MVRSLIALLKYVQQFLYRLQKTQPTPIQIVCIADTHSRQYPIPPGDLLIHAGDLTKSGKLSELQDAIAWLNAQPHRYKIAIAGNADLPLDPRINPSSASTIDWGDVIYLCGTATTLNFLASGRDLKVYGDPHVPRCGADGEEAFQYEVGEDYWRGGFPRDTDIIVTHAPPRYILDEWDASPEGCQSLYREVARVRPLLHVFGHIHPAYGREIVTWEILPHESHVLRGMMHGIQGRGVTLTLGNLTGRSLVAFVLSLWYTCKTIFFGKSLVTNKTTFVNAAAMSADGTGLRNKPVVVNL
jgi:hypothetical protein